ncbi:hypothetical protein H9P43_002278 [Blastocladiella emersonii ATCC 22665]|nr:hypothetical protein H9P43_002278 [Blastocladiella emersonii ATCC 22665]
MDWGEPWIITGWVLVVLLAAAIVNHLGDRKTAAWYVQIVVLVGWAGPFSILYFLPLDLSSTSYRKCVEASGSDCIPPLVYLSTATQRTVWQSIYWTLFFVTWLAIPILQSYDNSGGFTARQRFRKAIRYNAWYYGVLLIIGLVFLAYLAVVNGPINFAALKGVGMALSNAYGLILLILCLSYGLVDVPREVWHAADVRRGLAILEYRAPRYKESFETATRERDAIYREIAALDRAVAVSDQNRPYVEQLLLQCPNEHRVAAAAAAANGGGGITGWLSRVGMGGQPAAAPPPPPGSVTLKSLQQLNRSLKRAQRDKWNSLITTAHFYQDVLDNADNSDRRFHIVGKFRPAWRQRLDYVWYIYLRAATLRVLAVVFALFSAGILWSEITMNMGLSVLALITQTHSYTLLQAICLGAVVYLTACAFVPLLSLRVFSLHQLAPGHHSAVPSLLFFAAQMTRFTFPMAWNFTNLAQAERLVFNQVMGTVNLVPLLGEGFNDWVPISLVILCAITLLNVQGRIFKCLNLDTSYVAAEDEELGGEGGAERADGRLLLQQAKAQRDAGNQVAWSASTSSTAPIEQQRLVTAMEPSAASPAVASPNAISPTYLADDAFVPLSKRGKRTIGGIANSAALSAARAAAVAPSPPPTKLTPLPPPPPGPQTTNSASASPVPPPSGSGAHSPASAGSTGPSPAAGRRTIPLNPINNMFSNFRGGGAPAQQAAVPAGPAPMPPPPPPPATTATTATSSSHPLSSSVSVSVPKSLSSFGGFGRGTGGGSSGAAPALATASLAPPPAAPAPSGGGGGGGHAKSASFSAFGNGKKAGAGPKTNLFDDI